MPLVTSFRMYNATPRSAATWRALFERVFADTGIDVRVIDHGWPKPIDTLWSEPELCCAFMCGWPLSRAQPAMQPIAAPVPSPPSYESLPRYRSEFLVREQSGWTTLEETFGRRFGWMAENSHSGFNAPRAHLARYVRPDRAALFSHSIGPLGSPAKALEALAAQAVDVIALDSFYLDLVRHHDPAGLSGIRTVAVTAWAPIPPLVAAPGVDPAVVAALRKYLLALHGDLSYALLLRELLLERFAAVDVGAYEALEDLARLSRQADYASIR